MMDVDIYGINLHVLRHMPGVAQLVATNLAHPHTRSSVWEISVRTTDGEHVAFMDTDPLVVLRQVDQWIAEHTAGGT